MNIKKGRVAYLSSFVGPDFQRRFCTKSSQAISAELKVMGICRSLLRLGYDVTIFSTGITKCGRFIMPFSEEITFDEGTVKVEYKFIASFRGLDLLNQIVSALQFRVLGFVNNYKIFISYNISLSAVLSIGAFRESLRILEYEDNIFNQSTRDGKIKSRLYKEIIFAYLTKRIDGVIAVCNGLRLDNIVGKSILLPGFLEDHLCQKNPVLNRFTELKYPVHIILAGGVHFSKGSDLLIDSLTYVKYPCVLHFFGNGEFSAELLDLASRVPVIHQVINHGYLKHQDLYDFINNNAHILISATRNMGVGPQAAGFPFKMIEYASTGIPIISSSLGRLDEEFDSNITYFDDDDTLSIASCITDVIENYSRKKELANRLQSIAIGRYNVQNVSEYLRAYINQFDV
jgi:glycosyltransferase involved in cell wall biosynthesis